jgi:hypothetical protein
LLQGLALSNFFTNLALLFRNFDFLVTLETDSLKNLILIKLSILSFNEENVIEFRKNIETDNIENYM